MTEIETWAAQCIAGLDVAFPLTQRQAKLNALSIEDAIREHVQWFRDWEHSFKSTEGRFAAAVVCQDDQCQLGQWLYGLNTSLTKTFEYQNLKVAHAQFHRVAADIIKAYQHGGQSPALIKSQQKLLDISKQVVAALVDLEAVSHL